MSRCLFALVLLVSFTVFFSISAQASFAASGFEITSASLSKSTANFGDSIDVTIYFKTSFTDKTKVYFAIDLKKGPNKNCVKAHCGTPSIDKNECGQGGCKGGEMKSSSIEKGSGSRTFTVYPANTGESGKYTLNVGAYNSNTPSDSSRYNVKLNQDEIYLACFSGYLDKYRCSSNDQSVERKYQYSDCSTEWIGIMSCAWGCENGKCKTKTCSSKSESKCYDGDVYWYDSCGNRQEIKDTCKTNPCGNWGSNFCADDGNIKHSRTCYTGGCSGNSCYNNPYTDTDTATTCSYGCDSSTKICLAEPPNPDLIQISHPSSIRLDETATIKIKYKNSGGYSPLAYISPSFSEDWEIIDAGGGAVYGKWSRITTSSGGHKFADYSLIDFESSWTKNQEKEYVVKLSPKKIGKLFFNVRAAFKPDGGNRDYIRDPTSGSTDQQGWHVYGKEIDVKHPPVKIKEVQHESEALPKEKFKVRTVLDNVYYEDGSWGKYYAKAKVTANIDGKTFEKIWEDNCDWSYLSPLVCTISKGIKAVVTWVKGLMYGGFDISIDDVYSQTHGTKTITVTVDDLKSGTSDTKTSQINILSIDISSYDLPEEFVAGESVKTSFKLDNLVYEDLGRGKKRYEVYAEWKIGSQLIDSKTFEDECIKIFCPSSFENSIKPPLSLTGLKTITLNVKDQIGGSSDSASRQAQIKTLSVTDISIPNYVLTDETIKISGTVDNYGRDSEKYNVLATATIDNIAHTDSITGSCGGFWSGSCKPERFEIETKRSHGGERTVNLKVNDKITGASFSKDYNLIVYDRIDFGLVLDKHSIDQGQCVNANINVINSRRNGLSKYKVSYTVTKDFSTFKEGEFQHETRGSDTNHNIEVCVPDFGKVGSYNIKVNVNNLITGEQKEKSDSFSTNNIQPKITELSACIKSKKTCGFVKTDPACQPTQKCIEYGQKKECIGENTKIVCDEYSETCDNKCVNEEDLCAPKTERVSSCSGYSNCRNFTKNYQGTCYGTGYTVCQKPIKYWTTCTEKYTGTCTTSYDCLKPIGESKNKVCAQKCTPLWEIRKSSSFFSSSTCVFNSCGSGCGADGVTSFKTRSECIQKLNQGTCKKNWLCTIFPSLSGCNCREQDSVWGTCYKSEPCEKTRTYPCEKEIPVWSICRNQEPYPCTEQRTVYERTFEDCVSTCTETKEVCTQGNCISSHEEKTCESYSYRDDPTSCVAYETVPCEQEYRCWDENEEICSLSEIYGGEDIYIKYKVENVGHGWIDNPKHNVLQEYEISGTSFYNYSFGSGSVISSFMKVKIPDKSGDRIKAKFTDQTDLDSAAMDYLVKIRPNLKPTVDNIVLCNIMPDDYGVCDSIIEPGEEVPRNKSIALYFRVNNMFRREKAQGTANVWVEFESPGLFGEGRGLKTTIGIDKAKSNTDYIPIIWVFKVDEAGTFPIKAKITDMQDGDEFKTTLRLLTVMQSACPRDTPDCDPTELPGPFQYASGDLRENYAEVGALYSAMAEISKLKSSNELTEEEKAGLGQLEGWFAPFFDIINSFRKAIVDFGMIVESMKSWFGSIADSIVNFFGNISNDMERFGQEMKHVGFWVGVAGVLMIVGAAAATLLTGGAAAPALLGAISLVGGMMAKAGFYAYAAGWAIDSSADFIQYANCEGAACKTGELKELVWDAVEGLLLFALPGVASKVWSKYLAPHLDAPIARFLSRVAGRNVKTVGEAINLKLTEYFGEDAVKAAQRVWKTGWEGKLASLKPKISRSIPELRATKITESDIGAINEIIAKNEILAVKYPESKGYKIYRDMTLKKNGIIMGEADIVVVKDGKIIDLAQVKNGIKPGNADEKLINIKNIIKNKNFDEVKVFNDNMDISSVRFDEATPDGMTIGPSDGIGYTDRTKVTNSEIEDLFKIFGD